MANLSISYVAVADSGKTPVPPRTSLTFEEDITEEQVISTARELQQDPTVVSNTVVIHDHAAKVFYPPPAEG